MNKNNLVIPNIEITGSVLCPAHGEITEDDIDLTISNETLINQHFYLDIFKTNDDFENRKRIGNIHLVYLDIVMGRCDAGYNSFDVFDMASGDICRCIWLYV